MKKLVCGLAALVCLGFAAAAAVLPPEKLLPDDTLIFFTVPDVSRMLNTYSNSPQLQFWNDPAMRSFKEKFINKLKSEFINPLEHDLGVHFDDYTSLPQGQFTVAFVPEGPLVGPKDPPPPSLLVLIDTRDKSGQLKTNLADLKKKWVDSGKTIKTEKIRDVEFSVITLSTNDIPKSLQKFANNQGGGDTAAGPDAALKKDDKELLYLGQTDSLFVMGNSPKTIEKVLAALAGGSVKTLADVPAYAANHDAMFRNALSYGWFNAKAFLDMIKHLGDSAPSEMGPDKIFSALGLNGLKSLAFSYNYSDDGAQVNFMVGVPEAGRAGLFKILAGEPKDCTPPAFVPADAVKFQRWRIDGQKVYAGLRQMIGDVSPQYLGYVDLMLNSVEEGAKQKDPGFDIKKSLIGNLGDDVINYQKVPKGGSLKELSSPPSLYLVGSPNPEQFANTLKTLMTMAGPSMTPTERDFRGRKIYSIQLPGAPTGDDSKPSTSTLNYAFSGGYLAISTDAPMLEEYLRSSENQGKSLRETAGLAAATQKVAGSGTSLFGYSNDSETMRTFFGVLKNDSAMTSLLNNLDPLTSAMGMEDVNLKDWVDVSLLPNFDRVAKYFYFSVYAAGASPDGLFLRAFAPAPPQLKK